MDQNQLFPPENLDPQGEELLDYNQERQGLPCTALAWHPTSKASRVCVCAWHGLVDDFGVTLW